MSRIALSLFVLTLVACTDSGALLQPEQENPPAETEKHSAGDGTDATALFNHYNQYTE